MLTDARLATPLLPAALLLGALAFTQESEEETPDTTARVRADLAELSSVVAERRGLALEEPVPVEVLSLDDFRAALRTQLLELQPEGHFPSTTRAYRLFGILPPFFDGDLLDAFIESQASNIFGLYSPTRDSILVPDAFDHPMYRMQGGDAVRRELLAHELQHALQDRTWSLDALMGRAAVDHDHRLAVSALVEGDAVCTAMDWMLSLGGSSLSDFSDDLEAHVRDQIELGSALNSIGTGVFADPTFHTFNYATGGAFAKRLFDAGGWERVDRAFTDLPASTEQVLHPAKYFEERDWPVGFDLGLAPVLELAGWSLVASDTLGELVLRELFAEHLEPTEVARASIGWDGDRWLLLEKGEEEALIWTSAWDSRSDARDAYDALARVFGLRQHEELAFAVDLERRAGATRLVLDDERVALSIGFEREVEHPYLKDGGAGWFAADDALAAPLVHHPADEHEGRRDARTTRRVQREALAAIEADRVVVDGRTVRLRDIGLSFELPTDTWTVEPDTPMAAVRVVCLRGTRTTNFNVSVEPSDGLGPRATIDASLELLRNAVEDLELEFEEVRDDPRGDALEMRYSADLGGVRGWFRQVGFLRGEQFVFLTCTSVGAPIEGDVATEFSALIDSASFDDEPR